MLDGEGGVHDDVDFEHEAAVVAVVHLHLTHGGDVGAEVEHGLGVGWGGVGWGGVGWGGVGWGGVGWGGVGRWVDK